jgi:hypothetical protein
LDLFGLALALVHPLSKLFEYFCETVWNRNVAVLHWCL